MIGFVHEPGVEDPVFQRLAVEDLARREAPGRDIAPIFAIDPPGSEPAADTGALWAASPNPATGAAPEGPDLAEKVPEPGLARQRVGRWSFLRALGASGFLHAAAIAAIVLFERGPPIAGPQRVVEVELAPEQPPAAQRPQAKTPPAASALGSPTKSPAPAGPKPSALRKPPPPPAAARIAKKPQSARRQTVAAASTDAEAADPQTALPFFSMPSSFTSDILNSPGTQGDSYKGLVFGRLASAKRFPDSAGVHHESGQAIVAFTVDDKGALASLSLAQSSGFADLDAQALAMVRRVAPFPPPPPGATRSFAAAIDFGEK